MEQLPLICQSNIFALCILILISHFKIYEYSRLEDFMEHMHMQTLTQTHTHTNILHTYIHIHTDKHTQT